MAKISIILLIISVALVASVHSAEESQVVLQHGKKWCVPKPEASHEVLQANIDSVCAQGIDCKPIQEGGACFDPNNVWTHASYAMNAYYQAKGQDDSACDFSKSGLVTVTNPSYGSCVYPNSGAAAPEIEQHGKKWCVPRPEATDAQLQANLDWVCRSGIDCKPINAGGACFYPENVRSRAAYAMNAFYHANGKNDYNCDFAKTGLITISDPSYGQCAYHG